MANPSRTLKIALQRVPARRLNSEIEKAGKTLVQYKLTSLNPDAKARGKKARCPCCGQAL
jgi:predicted  nucleic acid-binding Zn ribbon protein